MSAHVQNRNPLAAHHADMFGRYYEPHRQLQAPERYPISYGEYQQYEQPRTYAPVPLPTRRSAVYEVPISPSPQSVASFLDERQQRQQLPRTAPVAPASRVYEEQQQQQDAPVIRSAPSYPSDNSYEQQPSHVPSYVKHESSPRFAEAAPSPPTPNSLAGVFDENDCRLVTSPQRSMPMAAPSPSTPPLTPTKPDFTGTPSDDELLPASPQKRRTSLSVRDATGKFVDLLNADEDEDVVRERDNDGLDHRRHARLPMRSPPPTTINTGTNSAASTTLSASTAASTSIGAAPIVPPIPVRGAGAVAPSKNRKFFCSWQGCGRGFTTSGHLARHYRIHTGEKNFQCLWPRCGSRFSRQDNMMQHYRTHQSPRSRSRRGSRVPSALDGTSAYVPLPPGVVPYVRPAPPPYTMPQHVPQTQPPVGHHHHSHRQQQHHQQQQQHPYQHQHHHQHQSPQQYKLPSLAEVVAHACPLPARQY